LKFSLIKVTAVPELEVADEVKPKGDPEHIEPTVAAAVTAVGIGLTTKVLEAVATPQEPPDEVRVKVAVPE
jgi:hypothetical protein